MTASPGRRFWPRFAALFLLWVVNYVPGMFRPPLFDDADASHAEAAREILTRPDWVTLHENGIRYLEKAPLPYWLVATSFRLFGVSEWTARLPQALVVLALLVLLLELGRKFHSVEAGFWAGVVAVTSFGPYLFTRIEIPDLLVGLWIGMGLYFFLSGWQEERPSRFACWGFAAAAGLNVLTKGLIGVVFPCAIIACFLLLTGNLRHLLRMRIVSSTIVFLAIAVPWHVLAALRNPPAGQSKGFLWFYFVNEHFLRYIGKRYPMDYGKVPLLLFWGLLLVWLLPWSAFLPQALRQVRLRWRGIKEKLDVSQAGVLLYFLWAAVILVFFSFSTRQEYYVTPALPGLALLIGIWLDREVNASSEDGVAKSGRIAANVLLAVGLLVSAVTMTLAVTSAPPPTGEGLAELLKKNPSVYVLSLGHFLDLTGGAMSFFRGPLIGTSLAFLAGTLLNWIWRRRGNARKANWALALMMCGFIYCAHVALVTFSPVLSSKSLALAIKADYRPGDQIVSDGEYSYASSVNFYTGIQLLILNGRVNGLWYGSLFPDSPAIFLDDGDFARLWAGAGRIYFVTSAEERKEYLDRIAPAYELARSGGKFVFSNHPPASGR